MPVRVVQKVDRSGLHVGRTYEWNWSTIFNRGSSSKVDCGDAEEGSVPDVVGVEDMVGVGFEGSGPFTSLMGGEMGLDLEGSTKVGLSEGFRLGDPAACPSH